LKSNLWHTSDLSMSSQEASSPDISAPPTSSTISNSNSTETLVQQSFTGEAQSQCHNQNTHAPKINDVTLSTANPQNTHIDNSIYQNRPSQLSDVNMNIQNCNQTRRQFPELRLQNAHQPHSQLLNQHFQSAQLHSPQNTVIYSQSPFSDEGMNIFSPSSSSATSNQLFAQNTFHYHPILQSNNINNAPGFQNHPSDPMKLPQTHTSSLPNLNTALANRPNNPSLHHHLNSPLSIVSSGPFQQHEHQRHDSQPESNTSSSLSPSPRLNPYTKRKGRASKAKQILDDTCRCNHTIHPESHLKHD
jgi:hypothetical protein